MGSEMCIRDRLIFTQLILNVQETKTIKVPIHEEQSFYSPANLLIGRSEKETEYLLSERSKKKMLECPSEEKPCGGKRRKKIKAQETNALGHY